MIFAVLIFCLGTSARAQNAGQIFDYLQNQIQNEMARQQQRKFERQQYDAFVTAWQSCFNQNNLAQCDVALSYPSLSENDRQRLLAQRAQIVALAEEQDRQRQLDQQRAEEERAEAERRLQEAAEAEAAQQAATRAFEADMNACGGYDVTACDRALASPLASSAEKSNMEGWRSAAQSYAVLKDYCRKGSVTSCDAALASEAITESDRALIASWRKTAAPFSQVSAAVADLPPAVVGLGSAAAILALVFGLRTVSARSDRRAVASASAKPKPPDLRVAEGSLASVAAPPPLPASPEGVPPTSTEPLPPSESDPSKPEQDEEPDPPRPLPVPIVRDTPNALIAMELALAFVDEVKHAATPAVDDKDGRKEHLNSLALASHQLDLAERLDPEAILEGISDNDIAYRYTLNELKSEALFLEGLTHRYFDTRRAVPPLEVAAKLNPTSPRIFYTLGILHAANYNKVEAVAALKRALELDPADIKTRKELVRAEAMTGTEIATYKATRAGERIYDVGIATANAGIKTWNVFATVYNIITLPIRIPLKITQKALSVLNYIVHG